MLSRNVSSADKLANELELIIKSGIYLNGPHKEKFEQRFADYLGRGVEVVGVANATDAIEILLRSLGIGAGDEVIMPAHTALATAAGVLMAGATPVLVDINPQDYCISVDKASEAISSRTRAIIGVHLYGHPFAAEAFTELCSINNIYLLEDCSQSHGARLGSKMTGTLGHAAVFSFYPTKNLGGICDAGAIVTVDSELAKSLRQVAQYGWNSGRLAKRVAGRNSRMSDIAACVLNRNIGYLEEDNAQRIRRARFLSAELQSQPQLTVPTFSDLYRHVFHQYVIRYNARDELKRDLESAGFRVGIHYSELIHQHPAYANSVKISGSLENSEKIVTEILSLPITPDIDMEELRALVARIKSFVCNTTASI